MKKMMVFAGAPLFAASLALSGCASSEESVKKAMLKNPDVLFQVIEENPEAFIAAVNRAARSAQAKEAENRGQAQQKQMEEDLKNPKQPKLEASRRISGSAEGPVVIVEYADFQCPACAAGHRSMSTIRKKYGANVQVYFKNLPLDFHPMAMPLARTFEAVRRLAPGKALAFHDLMFEDQRRQSEPNFIKTSLKKLGLDAAKIEKESQSAEIDRILEEDRAEFEKFGFNGTPSIIVNGVALNGAQSVEALEMVIRQTAPKIAPTAN